jgi:hypothetical protein
MRIPKIFRLCIAAISLACGSSACIAQVNWAGWGSGDPQSRAPLPQAISGNRSSVREGWMRNGVEDGRSSATLADGPSLYRDASVGELLIEHWLGLKEATPEAMSSMRLRPTLRRDQIGVRLQIRF